MTDDERNLLIRVDERTKNTDEKVSLIQKQLESKYVTQDEFGPIKRMVNLIVGTIVVGFLSAIATLVYVVKQ